MSSTGPGACYIAPPKLRSKSEALPGAEYSLQPCLTRNSYQEYLGSCVLHLTAPPTMAPKQKAQPVALPICRAKPMVLYCQKLCGQPCWVQVPSHQAIMAMEPNPAPHKGREASSQSHSRADYSIQSHLTEKTNQGI